MWVYLKPDFILMRAMKSVWPFSLPPAPPQGQDNIYDDPYQPEMDQPQATSAGRRRAYYRNRDHFATIRTASLVSLLSEASSSSSVVLSAFHPETIQRFGFLCVFLD